MKRKYVKPIALKIEFDYAETVVASAGKGGKNPAQCQGSNPGWGCGMPGENVSGQNPPGNCTTGGQRKQSHNLDCR